MKSQSKGKVYVGMSGGVDSSVSAVLLKEQGFDVTGVFIKVWQPDWFVCTWREDRLDAMRVCVQLGIPFITLDLEKEYKKEVVDYMIDEYKRGNTPNPDVMCNKFVKFGGFFEWAMKHGADYVATGHYAQIRKEGAGWRMLAGKDKDKDQSYFLWTLTQNELSRTLFPVGGMDKTKTRKLAKRYNLPVAEKRDSQGLCFIGKVDVREFLKHYIEPKKGNVLDEKGNSIGKHDGAIFLTLGERHGFSVTTKSPSDKPYYIVSRDLENNTVTVSHKSESGNLSVEKNQFALTSVNWISGMPEDRDEHYTARVRHLGELMPCTIEVHTSKRVIIRFERLVAVASGQSIVVYSGDVCMGGGIAV